MTTTESQSGACSGATPADQHVPLSQQVVVAGWTYANICDLRSNRDELAACEPQDLIKCGFKPLLVLDGNLWLRIVELGEAVINVRWRASNGFTPLLCDVE